MFFSKRIWQLAFWCIPVLLLTELTFGKYSLLVLGHEYPYFLCRNWLVTGLTYILIGAWLKVHKPSLTNRTLCAIISALIAVTILEKYLLLHYSCNAQREAFIATPFLSAAVFLLFLNLNVRASLCSRLGEKYSEWIYIVHPAIYKVLFY